VHSELIFRDFGDNSRTCMCVWRDDVDSPSGCDFGSRAMIFVKYDGLIWPLTNA